MVVPDRTHVRRQPTRGHYDLETVCAVLDAAKLAHVAFVDAGQPYCIPMMYVRVGPAVYIHGSSASRVTKLLATGIPACVTVTLLDGLVLARSAFEHSGNYRSAVLLGSFHRVEGDAERLAALAAITNTLVPGRWSEVRKPNRKELKATQVLVLPIAEASAKIRTGPPSDDNSEDAGLDVWAGELPIASAFGSPIPSPGLRRGIPLAPSAQRLLGLHGPGRQLSTGAVRRTSTPRSPTQSLPPSGARTR